MAPSTSDMQAGTRSARVNGEAGNLMAMGLGERVDRYVAVAVFAYPCLAGELHTVHERPTWVARTVVTIKDI